MKREKQRGNERERGANKITFTQVFYAGSSRFGS